MSRNAPFGTYPEEQPKFNNRNPVGQNTRKDEIFGLNADNNYRNGQNDYRARDFNNDYNKRPPSSGNLPTINQDTAQINPVRVQETQSLRQTDSREGYDKYNDQNGDYFNANYDNPNKAILPTFAKSNKNLGNSMTKIKRPEQYKSYQPPDPKVIELEGKMRDMERIVQHMTDQLERTENRYEDQSSKQLKTNYYETEMRTKLEQSQKHAEEHNNVLTSDLLQKLSNLESRLNNEERQKQMLKEKLLLNEQNLKELMGYVNTINHTETNDLLEMKGQIQEKISEDQQVFIKEREKTKALFSEVVRIGEAQDKNSDHIHSLNLALENRLQQLEGKFVQNEKNTNSSLHKGELGYKNLNDFTEKTDRRTQQLEANLIGLGKEQMKDKDAISRIEALNSKMTDDLKGLLTNMQSEFQQKLENKNIELVNRIVNEHVERQRQQEDIKQQVDVRSKLIEDKVGYEREEMRDRYMALDVLVRAEFQRKEESVKSQNDLIENNIKNLQNNIKDEEYSRVNFENAIRLEVGKMQEMLKKDMEYFRSQFALENDKLTDIIKGEIDTRFSSDVELKNLANMMLNSLTSEVNDIKGAMDKQNKIFAKELKEVSQNSAERDNQLSKFVESENGKVIENLNTKYEKLKYLQSRIAEQFKAHLIKFDSKNEDLAQSNIEQSQKMDEFTDDLRQNLDELGNFCINPIIICIEKRMENKHADESTKISRVLDNMGKAIDDRIDKIEEKELKDFDIIKEVNKLHIKFRSLIGIRFSIMQNRIRWLRFQKFTTKIISKIQRLQSKKLTQ